MTAYAPPGVFTAQSGGEDRQVGLPNSPGDSVLAETLVVSTAGGPDVRSTAPTTTVQRSTAGSGRERGPSVSGTSARAPPVNCLEIIRQRSREDGFSERTAELLAGGRRESTLRTYSQRLAPYYQWCRERDFSPTRASVTNVADFLASKVDAGLQCNTVKNYKSTILSIHRGFRRWYYD
jgi:hypothetical protein